MNRPHTLSALLVTVLVASCSSDGGDGASPPGSDGGVDAAPEEAAPDSSEEASPDVEVEPTVTYTLTFVREDKASLAGFTAELRARYDDGTSTPSKKQRSNARGDKPRETRWRWATPTRDSSPPTPSEPGSTR